MCRISYFSIKISFQPKLSWNIPPNTFQNDLIKNSRWRPSENSSAFLWRKGDINQKIMSQSLWKLKKIVGIIVWCMQQAYKSSGVAHYSSFHDPVRHCFSALVWKIFATPIWNFTHDILVKLPNRFQNFNSLGPLFANILYLAQCKYSAICYIEILGR